jgi:release factor glutamine methyltransferase
LTRAVDYRLAQRFSVATEALSLAGIASPRLTAEALLAHVLGVSRTQLLAQPERPLPDEAQLKFDQLVRRAAEGEPLAYLTGVREFHGLEFVVNPHVLVPRPETELLVDEALRFLTAERAEGVEKKVLDVGTGSGCIAVTIAAKCPAAGVTALDISEDALTVARANAQRHNVANRIAFFKSDLLAAIRYLPTAFHLLCANLPYIASDELRELPVAKHEPRLALDGGPDGLLWVRRLLPDAPRVMAPGGLLLLEIGAAQGSAAAALAQAAFPTSRVTVLKDYAGLDRIVRIET